MRLSMTYDQGCEMAFQKAFTLQTGIAVYFCDPHSPFQRKFSE
jgi:IS30 family transposase